MGVIGVVDRAMLCGYAQAWSRWVAAEAEVRSRPVITRSVKGHPMATPWLGVANRAMDYILKFGAELGLSPSSRARLKVDKGARNELQEFVRLRLAK